MKKKIRVVVVLAVLAIAAFFGIRSLTGTAGDGDGALLVTGVVEVTDVEIAFRIPGRVEARLISEGDTVTAGDPVATLEAADLAAARDVRKSEVAVARASLDELLAGSREEDVAAAAAAADRARAALAELENGTRAEDLAVAKARTQAAEAEVTYAKAELDRVGQLLARAVVTSDEGDRARRAFDAATARLAEARAAQALAVAGPRPEAIAAARAALAEAEARRDLVRAGPRAETIAVARARVEQATAALAKAENQLGYARVASPITGTVLVESIEAGEYVSPGTPVVTVGHLDEVWVRAFIPETDLGRVKLGQRVRVTSDTWPGKAYEGRITFLSSEAEFTPKNVQTPEQRVKLVYRIKVTVPNPDHELKPGMPVDGEILLAEKE